MQEGGNTNFNGQPNFSQFQNPQLPSQSPIISQQPVYLTEPEKKSKKTLITIFIALLFIIIGTIIFFLRESIFGPNETDIKNDLKSTIEMINDGIENITLKEQPEDNGLNNAIFAVKIYEFSSVYDVELYYEKLGVQANKIKAYKNINNETLSRDVDEILQSINILEYTINHHRKIKDLTNEYNTNGYEKTVENLDNLKKSTTNTQLKFFTSTYDYYLNYFKEYHAYAKNGCIENNFYNEGCLSKHINYEEINKMRDDTMRSLYKINNSNELNALSNIMKNLFSRINGEIK